MRREKDPFHAVGIDRRNCAVKYKRLINFFLLALYWDLHGKWKAKAFLLDRTYELSYRYNTPWYLLCVYKLYKKKCIMRRRRTVEDQNRCKISGLWIVFDLYVQTNIYLWMYENIILGYKIFFEFSIGMIHHWKSLCG